MSAAKPPVREASTWSPLGLLRLLGLFALSALFTYGMVQWSLAWGRLSHTPRYDDIVYLFEGLRFYYFFHEYDYLGGYQTLASWLGMIYTNPPHSPFSVYLAAISYNLFGLSPTSPYYGNAVIVFALLWAVEYFTRGIGPLQRVMLVCAALAFPMAASAVAEYRPDIAYALLTAIATILLLRKPLMESRPVEIVMAGVLTALALVMKTTTFPLVIGTIGISLFVSSLPGLLPLRRERLTALAWRWVWLLLPILIIAVPFYLVAAEGIYLYLHEALVARGDLYTAKVTTFQKYTFYFHGQMLAEGMGTLWWVVPWCIGLLLLGLGFGLRVHGWFYLRLLAPMAVAYVILTLSPMKYLFAGSYFYWVQILACLLILRDLWAACEQAPKRTAAHHLFSLGLHLVVLATILSWAPPVLYRIASRQRALYTESGVIDNKMADKLAAAINPEAPVSIFCLTALSCGIVPKAVQYDMWLRNRPNVSFYDNIHIGDVPYLQACLDKSDFVVTTDPDNPYLLGKVDLPEKMAAVNDYVRSTGQFKLLGEWAYPYGSKLYVYQRTKPAPEVQH